MRGTVCAHERGDGDASGNQPALAAKPAVSEAGVPWAAVRGEWGTLTSVILGHYLIRGETGELIRAPGIGFNEGRKSKNSCKGQQNRVKSLGILNEHSCPDLLFTERLCDHGIWLVSLMRSSDTNCPDTHLALGD